MHQIAPDDITPTEAASTIALTGGELAERFGHMPWKADDLWPAQPWEATKIGAGTPPIRTPHGWLMIYHGVAGQILENVDHQPYVRYSAGAMLLDIDDPRTIIYRSPTPILAPETDDERAGIVPNVVFPTGIDLRENGRVDIYYGMADAAIGVARLDLPARLDQL